MHQQLTWVARLTLIVSLFGHSVAIAGNEGHHRQILLHSGAKIQGTVLLDKAERIAVDLGFTVLTIPRTAIQHIGAGEQAENSLISHTLYRTGVRSQPHLSVRTNLQRCAEAVLRVKTPTGLGSGFVIHSDGYVVTNHHVIDGEYQITLTLFESTAHELRPISFTNVRIVALDAPLDLALLKIEDLNGRSLPSVTLGDSLSLAQAENVFSIGSPLGFDRTVSEGIISLKNRLIGSQIYLQSTVQINPGNSGGPLFNLHGEVIGVNNMKIGAIGIEGLSFSIPVNTLKTFLDHADAFAFDTSNPNHGFRYNPPPTAIGAN